MKKVAQINKKIIKFNVHTHSSYCDGNGLLSDFIAQALKCGYSSVGFSSHAPLLFETHFSIDIRTIQQYVDEIRHLQRSEPRIKLLAGMECDYIPGMSSPFSEFKKNYGLDYIIGGVHLVKGIDSNNLWFIDGPLKSEFDKGLCEVFQNDIKKGVAQYYQQICEMLTTQELDILAHVDKIKMHNSGRYFSEEEHWYQNLCMEVIDILKQKEVVVEINTRGIYKKRCPDYYPSKFILQNLLENNIRITISSDAHQPSELDLLMDEAAIYAAEIGFKEVWQPLGNNQWTAVSLKG